LGCPIVRSIDFGICGNLLMKRSSNRSVVKRHLLLYHPCILRDYPSRIILYI
jgi:hypothetical protein